MDCHCKDHLPGEWHSHEDCDCHKQDYPTYAFVITKVMDQDPGTGTVYISTSFMEKLCVKDGDAVEILVPEPCVVQAKEHPNPWIDSRMIALDRNTLEKIGLQLFGQVKLRKVLCPISESITLEVPSSPCLTRAELRALVECARGAVIAQGDKISLKTGRGIEVDFRVVAKEPETISRISDATEIRLVDVDGKDYVSRRDMTFQDVGGLADAIRKVREVVQLPLQHPEIFAQLGIDPPRGVLLYGPSGTGKTLIARAVAGETGCFFKFISGTEIMDKYYGESEAKLRAAFEEAYKNAPAIIFIDEVDALAPRRDTSEGDVERRVTAQLLALMDGMLDRGAVIVLSATNLPNVLDTALRRPGRFDREILIGVPDRAGRREILEIHTRDMPMGEVELNELAERIHGFVGADIKALCQEAGYKALMRILPGLEQTEQQLSEDFLEAIRVEQEDFDAALKEMRPSSSREYEVNLSGCGWACIAGYDDEIRFVKDMVLWPLQHCHAIADLGVSYSGGLLITGPPGVGKTLMARSLARESGFNVIEIRGPELLSKYVGESERNIRELFRRARQMAPTVVILDGIDAMTSSGWSDSKVMDRVANQLVMEMNAIAGDRPVLVVAVAERAEDLPPALLSTGRFGTDLRLRLPDQAARVRIFTLYLKRDKIRFEGDLDAVALGAEGLSPGDIEEICRRVILHAARMGLESEAGALTSVTVAEKDLMDALARWRSAAASFRHDRA